MRFLGGWISMSVLFLMGCGAAPCETGHHGMLARGGSALSAWLSPRRWWLCFSTGMRSIIGGAGGSPARGRARCPGGRDVGRGVACFFMRC